MSSMIGILKIEANENVVCRISFVNEMKEENVNPLCEACRRQLEEYFQGIRTRFDLPLAEVGTPFTTKVYHALCDIPYGEVRSYKDIAIAIDHPKAYRAVGMANHRNPIPIIIPCHRVIGSHGKLTGYAGGLDIKEKLLCHEQKVKNTW